jgi:hypothetical protein
VPKIQRQTHLPPSANGRKVESGGSVLDRIQPLSDSKEGRLKMALYGNPKTGKTRLACTFPKPLLIVGTEDGTASVIGTKGVEFVWLHETSDLNELIDGPLKEGRWKTVVLDNATKLRDMRISELWRAKGGFIPDKKPFLYADKAWKEVWVQCSQDLKDALLNPLLDLPRQLPVNVVIISQEQDYTFDDVNQSDVMRPMVGSALGKTVATFVHAECDYGCNTFIREEVVAKTETHGGKSVTFPRKTGKKQFCLRVGPNDVYWTGFRQAIGAPELPDVIVDPDYSKIIKLIKGG